MKLFRCLGLMFGVLGMIILLVLGFMCCFSVLVVCFLVSLRSWFFSLGGSRNFFMMKLLDLCFMWMWV